MRNNGIGIKPHRNQNSVSVSLANGQFMLAQENCNWCSHNTMQKYLIEVLSKVSKNWELSKCTVKKWVDQWATVYLQNGAATQHTILKCALTWHHAKSKKTQDLLLQSFIYTVFWKVNVRVMENLQLCPGAGAGAKHRAVPAYLRGAEVLYIALMMMWQLSFFKTLWGNSAKRMDVIK